MKKYPIKKMYVAVLSLALIVGCSDENQCVQRELKNSANPDNDKSRVSKACECISTFMMKDLTAIEAEKFLTEHENAQSLTIKYENAAYHCLQQKAPPQAAHLFGKQ